MSISFRRVLHAPHETPVRFPAPPAGPNRRRGTAKWQIGWDSLIDGTGKEVYADQVRRVNLHAFYCDEQILVTTRDDDPALEDAQGILVFVREDDMDDKLERYRVS